MIATLLIVTNLLSPTVIDQIRIGAGHTITGAHDPRFDMMYITIEDWSDLKTTVESHDKQCQTEKNTLESEYKTQLKRSQDHCVIRVDALTASLNKARDEIKLLQENNQTLESHNKLLKWVSIGVGAVSVGVSGYFIAR